MTQLIAWFVWLAMLVSAIQSLFFTWLCWPRLRSLVAQLRRLCYRQTHCVWCWEALHIRRWWPRKLSSSCCPYHQQVELKRLAARRAARLAAAQATVPVATVVEVATLREQREVLA